MKLRFLGKNSVNGDCPTLYATDRDSYVVQGFRVFENDLLTRLDIRDGQTVVAVPEELFTHLTKDGASTGEIQRLEAPVMIRTEDGTFVVQGQEVTDTEALEQMSIPAWETCVEVPRPDLIALLEEPRGADYQRPA
ncbi:hypothetical protein M1P56_09725 [Streptomyces sp. HU2014]|uniref:hypothetical protein n=1 Tax=Streptomyces sp. HU2014 TaxID=2939414 RepID=UPI00200D1AE5|nr:hypothetical protein [Streptomyces sp. HU2014]UQI44604.1 hypothetical protein M1P56_09725 [Streptomyces sp. HU2014]